MFPVVRVVLVGVLLAGCAGGSSDPASHSPAAPGSASAGAPGGTGGCTVEVTDAWVKAAASGMTAAFARITNTGADRLIVVSASSAAAGRMEIHEVASVDGAMVMRPKDGGLVIEAGAAATLGPGGDHLMLMELPGPIEPGDEVDVTLACQGGGTAGYVAVAKPFDGAAEDYEPAAASARPAG